MATPVEDKIASEEDGFDISSVERAQDEADVIIVGGGPAGLSAAIRIKQLAEEKGEEIRVVVLEKGAEVGNHILSGAVIQTNALDELLPNWKELGAPLNQPATEDTMRFLTPSGSFPMPHPPQMNNKVSDRWRRYDSDEFGADYMLLFSPRNRATTSSPSLASPPGSASKPKPPA